MNCENCSMASACGGDMGELTDRLLRRHTNLLTIMVVLAKGDVSGGVLMGFVMGYLLRGAEGPDDVQLDMSVWGECFDGDIRP